MKQKRSESTTGNPQPESPQLLWIFWGALTGSLGVYAVLGVLIRQTSEQPLVSEDLAVLIPVFISMALAVTSVIFACAPALAKQTNYQTYSIIRWAFAEAVGIIGLVLFFLGASWLVFGAFLAWAFFLEYYLRPTPDAYAQFQRVVRQGWQHNSSRVPFSHPPSQ